MPNNLKINALVVLALSILFVLFFDFTKHSFLFSSINPFADDPYDAIGTFAFQGVVALSVLSLFRAFRPYHSATPSAEQKTTLARTQIAVILAVVVALMGNLVAMGRHTSMWLSAPTGTILLVTVGLFILLSVGAGIFVFSSAQKSALTEQGSWKRVTLVSLGFIAVLSVYPESVIESTIGALLTVIIGATLLFMPIWAWGTFLFSDTSTSPKTVTPKWLWGAIILIGVLLGFTIVLRELSEGGAAIDLAGSVFIIAIFVGLETAGLVIGYVFSGKFLNLFRQPNQG